MEETTEVILKQTITETINVDPELQAEIRDFTRLALKEARAMMKFGLGSERLALVRIVLGAAVRGVGKDFQKTEQEGRVALESIFTDMRIIPQEPHAAPVASLAPPVDDSNQGTDH